MPLGAGMSSRASVAKLRVSMTETRLASRDEIQTASPRGVNSRCNTAAPGSSVLTTVCVGVSMTWTRW